VNKVRFYKEHKQYLLQIDDSKSVVALPWALTNIPTISELSIDNVMQHLTSMEADLAMLNWFDCLTLQSHIQVVVPDADYFMRMWLDADWTKTTLLTKTSLARSAFSGLFGAQEDGNPRDTNYDFAQPGVFKSAYNAKRLEVLLERAGFCHIELSPSEDGVLVMRAKKTMQRGERQIAKKLSDVRVDHLNRYKFAAEYFADLVPSTILDCACGVGYGSNMLANELNTKVLGVDIDAGAIEHANLHYKSALNQYTLADAKSYDFGVAEFDAVISFETIEHIDFDQALINKFYQALKPGGRFICSTPNEEVMPFDKHKFPFHIKHYTNSEIVELLTKAGFNNIEIYAQQGYVDGEVKLGTGGHFTILVGCKAE
jgi:2-polyprenyl-3-methyl-5-hydroxy-6-metoxy-1,4-benzoquinol methylase